MTNEQAIEIIKKYDVLGCGYCHQGGKEIEEAFNMATKALDTWDKIFTSYENLVAKIENEDDISHATERIDEWCVEQLRSVISDYYADRIIKELKIDPYQTDMDDAWEQSKAKYSLCNRCTKQPNCDDGKRNLYMNACSRFVDVVDMPQADGEKMRDATPEERESIDKYIKSISKPTGVNFWDLDDNDDCISRKAVLSLLADHFDNVFDMVKELPSVNIPSEHDGCKDCVYQDNPQDAMPCRECKHNYMDKWKAKANKVGHWIMPQQDDGMSDPIYYQVRCSKCGFDLDPQTWHQELHQYDADKFCPKCGCAMKGESE